MTGLEALLLLGGAALLYIGNQARSVANLTFFPDAVTGMAFEGISPVMYLSVLVQNTSNVAIDLYSLSGSVYVDNTLVGNISNFTPTRINANSETVMPLKVRFAILGIVNDIIQSFQQGNFKKAVVLDGTVNANGVQVPLTLTFQIG